MGTYQVAFPSILGINQPWILRWRPHEGLRLCLSVDAAQNRRYGIKREDDWPKSIVNGKRLTDPREMREGLIYHELEGQTDHGRRPLVCRGKRQA